MMTDMSKHARRSPVTPVAWAVLISMGTTSVIYNVYHAVEGHHLSIGLALPYGVAPVFAAMCLSHLVAVYKGGWVMRAAAFVVMLGAMGLSAGAIAAVVAPAAPGALKWLFGCLLDAAALIALRAILSERERMSADVTAREAAEAAAAEAAGRVLALEDELEDVREAFEAELGEAREALDAALRERGEALSRAALMAGKVQRSKGKARSALRGAPKDDVTMEAKALEVLASDLSMSGAELARRLGVSPAHGRRLRARLTKQDRPLESARGASS